MKPILFCDFDGVLCFDRYWRSLPAREFEQIQKLLFRKSKRAIVDDWMRGKYTAEDINKMVSEKTSIPYVRLWKTFVRDCKTMKVSKKVLNSLQKLRTKYIVILLTGNMDSFERFTRPALRLEKYFDKISNSYFEKVLKHDDGGGVYRKYARKYKVPIKSCCLIDDKKKVCRLFESLGGKAFHADNKDSVLPYLVKLKEKN